jgi:hypothetical protein
VHVAAPGSVAQDSVALCGAAITLHVKHVSRTSLAAASAFSTETGSISS